jgi:hypothetical protein
MSTDADRPATKADIQALREFVLERETSLIWKVIALQITLIAAISGGQWAAFIFVLQHYKP